MAMKKDDDKTKKSASSSKSTTSSKPASTGSLSKPFTISGKKPYKMGEINYTDMSGKKRMIKADAPKSKSIMISKGPAPKMNAEATGERNFDKTPRTRATVSIGPATLSMGGKTAKSKGGMDMSKGTVQPKKSVNPTAKTSGVSGSGFVAPSTPAGAAANLTKQEIAAKRNRNLALGIGGTVVGAGIMLSGGGKKIKQAAKYIGDTKERKARNAAQKAENDAMIVERKAKAEAKNPSTPKANIKASKSTMKNIKRLKKGQ